MSGLRYVGDLFAVEPIQWGLRGDPFLWRDMREHLKHTPMPQTDGEFANQIKEVFKSLTGHHFDETKPFCLKKYAHGGMSSGMVSPEFWQGPGIRLLRERYVQT